MIVHVNVFFTFLDFTTSGHVLSLPNYIGTFSKALLCELHEQFVLFSGILQNEDFQNWNAKSMMCLQIFWATYLTKCC